MTESIIRAALDAQSAAGIDGSSATSRLIATAVVVAVASLLFFVLPRIMIRGADDSYARYYRRKFSRYLAVFAALVAVGYIWRAFGGQVGLVLGLATAGVAFAMQEVIGAIAGWFNILSGRIFRVGDRIEMGGVRGDVIDVTPLRTKLLEMGTPIATDDQGGDTGTWVKGRQYTGRVVSVSNKSTFTEPVFNYSTMFEYVWEEMFLPIPYRCDWQLAEKILLEELHRASDVEGATRAIEDMTRKYPIPRAEVDPRVFVRATENWMELAGRFVVPVRTARVMKDEITRKVIARLDAAGIEVASETIDTSVRMKTDDRLDRS